ncbi:helix-turn-helix domain-containing protein [Paenibacillus sp. MER 99-2]|uniref:AraC family transcriptional regulator n=1 Tax=Paenibacillus sp. MER 99-2 TaxID=2939572 RepID=UPI00203ED6C1|nr:helix-turn-helix domain-containing protein [Paenibacillus sp. MER 99-2]MCM3171916.1 helix-turn-helix domain-containing protein [Paenibacillus sp. MER 99-2]
MHNISTYIQLQQYALLCPTPLSSESTLQNIRIENNHADCCTLLIIMDHGVRLHIDNVTQNLRQGSCIILSYQHIYRLETDNSQARVAWFTFKNFEVDGLILRRVPYATLISGYPYKLPMSILKTTLVAEDWECSWPRNAHVQKHGEVRTQEQHLPTFAPEYLILQAKLQLILGMMAQMEQANPSVDQEKAVHQSLLHMEQHYNKELTVEYLAEMTGMIRWQYSKKFKTITGKQPIEYLTELRVKHAKNLLLRSSETLREIAKQVGFKDEYYFSRRFHQFTGYAPREFANIFSRTHLRIVTDSLGRKVQLPETTNRIVATGTNTIGELLAIGIMPIGAGIATMKSQVIYKNKLHSILDIGLQASPEQVSPLKPDLMLLGNYCERQLSQLDAIAPTIVYSGRNTTYERLLYIADLFNRNKVAEQWINRYEANIRRLRRQLSDQYHVGEHATVYLVLGKKVYVMGQNGFAATLYESLGFRPPAPVNHFIQEGMLWVQIELNQISRYLSDRNFVLSNPSDLQFITPLFSEKSSPYNVHWLDSIWNYDDPITRERLLSVLPSIFTNPKIQRRIL